MEPRKSIAHAEAEQTRRRAGYRQERIEDVLRQLPDPIDTQRDAEALFRLGVSGGALTSDMGGSPSG